MKYPSVLNEGCCCQYSQRRSWSQSAAESWTWALAVLDHPAACTALANSLPWRELQQTCSFLPNETRPAAGADHLLGPGFWEKREDGYFWTVLNRPAVIQAQHVWNTECIQYNQVCWGRLPNCNLIWSWPHYWLEWGCSVWYNHVFFLISIHLFIFFNKLLTHLVVKWQSQHSLFGFLNF